MTSIVRAALALGHALKAGTQARRDRRRHAADRRRRGDRVLALSAYGRVPAMLNFTAGAAEPAAALKAAKVKRIVTAHRFIELGKFEALEDVAEDRAKLVYLEDVRENLSLFDKVAGGRRLVLPASGRARRPRPMRPPSSCSPRAPKANPRASRCRTPTSSPMSSRCARTSRSITTDVVFNPLPTFHSFGLTVGALMPLYLGREGRAASDAAPAAEIVRRIRSIAATILLATDTFVSQYARAGEADDLDEPAACGLRRRTPARRDAPAAPAQVRQSNCSKATASPKPSPVLAANQPGANRPGTVGHLMPAIEARVEPVEGIPTAAGSSCGAQRHARLSEGRPARRDRAAAGRLARHRRCRRASTRTATSRSAAG